MATLTKKRPAPLEEENEMEEEGPDDEEGELRQGSVGRGRRSKRSMDGDCSCGKRKGKCDSSCGKAMKDGGMMYKPKMDRADALTPQEYLAACDLGIQGQPRSYIRARLDYAERLDLKCGKGAIAEGKKCHKGPATRVQGSQMKGGSKVRGLKTAAKVAAIGGAAMGAGYLVGRSGLGAKVSTTLRNTARDIKAEGQQVVKARKMGAKTQLKALKYVGSNIKGKAKIRQLQERSMPKPDTLYGRVVDPWKSGKGSELLDRTRAHRTVRGMKRAAKRDSIWADGFSPEHVSLAV